MTNSATSKIFIISILLFLALCLFLYCARNILTPFLLAAFIAYLISPIALKIQSYGFRRWVGVFTIAVIFVIFLAALLTVLIPLLISEANKLNVNVDEYYEYFANYLQIIKIKIETAAPIVKQYDVYDVVSNKVREFVFSQAQEIPGYIMSVFSVFSVVILVPMLVLFMLFSFPKSINTAVNLLPSKYVETTLSIIYEVDFVFGRFIRGQLIEASFVGTMSVIFLSILGINFSLLIGIVAGIANTIPYLGPFVGLFLALIVGIAQYQTFAIAVKITIAYAIIQFVDNNFIQPFVVGPNVNLGPVMMVFAMLACGKVFGFLGIIFAVPAAAILKMILIMFIQKYKRAFI
jgi:predicted PurR-regulated permease PerM